MNQVGERQETNLLMVTRSVSEECVTCQIACQIASLTLRVTSFLPLAFPSKKKREIQSFSPLCQAEIRVIYSLVENVNPRPKTLKLHRSHRVCGNTEQPSLLGRSILLVQAVSGSTACAALHGEAYDCASERPLGRSDAREHARAKPAVAGFALALFCARHFDFRFVSRHHL